MSLSEPFSEHGGAPQPYLDLEGQRWLYVKDRLLDHGQVYRLPDSSQFLRIGSKEKISAEADFAAELFHRGFPVPEVLERGEIADQAYYAESAIGSESLGDRFRREIKETGRASEESFAAYCDLTCRFLAAQLDPANRITGPSELRKGIWLENVKQENPDFNAEQLDQVVSEIERDLHLLPLVFTQGDLSPFNMFDGGVIDFEHRFIAPAGHDVLVGAIFERFWAFKDASGASQLLIDFTPEEIAEYTARVDKTAAQHGVSDFTTYTEKFVMLRSIWSLGSERTFARQSGDITKWRFRRAVFKYCLDRYLRGAAIDTSEFERLELESEHNLKGLT